MNQIEQAGISPAPAFMESAFPAKREYWGCTGTEIPVKKQRTWFRKPKPADELWVLLNYSKEDAEAVAILPLSNWKWDGLPARKFSLASAMRQARKSGCAGVQVTSFVNGQWQTVNTFLACEPLPEELR
jgi:hypothetical protein